MFNTQILPVNNPNNLGIFLFARRKKNKEITVHIGSKMNLLKPMNRKSNAIRLFLSSSFALNITQKIIKVISVAK
jgi:hypothetical protein